MITQNQIQPAAAQADLEDEKFQEWEFYGVPVTSEVPSEGALDPHQSLQTQWRVAGRIRETEGGVEIFLYSPSE